VCDAFLGRAISTARHGERRLFRNAPSDRMNVECSLTVMHLSIYLLQGKASGTGKSSSSATTSTSTADAAVNSYEDLKTRKAWDFAISPVKSLPMQAFMLYMSGGGVQIFSMGIVAMLLLSPFKNLSFMNEGALMLSFCCTTGGGVVRCLCTYPRSPPAPPSVVSSLPLLLLLTGSISSLSK
jgi:Protein of unknown function (DUF1077)